MNFSISSINTRALGVYKNIIKILENQWTYEWLRVKNGISKEDQ